jgi:hypothetical protein
MVKKFWGVPILMVCGVSAVEFSCGIDSSFSSHQQFEYKVFVPLPWEPSASESFETRDFPKLTESIQDTSPRIHPWRNKKPVSDETCPPNLSVGSMLQFFNLKSKI